MELEDLRWFPRVIRDRATEFLEFLEAHLGFHRIVAPRLAAALASARESRVVDLCSGGGGPVAAIQAALAAEGVPATFVLTDRFPNLPAFRRIAASHPEVTFVESPVDARRVPRDLVGMRTLFNAFHHFAPPDARAILVAAVAAGAPIALFELSERSARTMAALLCMPVAVWLATPFMRPFRWDRLLWTYLVPLVPLTCLWDGLVSQWRAYAPDELNALVHSLGTNSFTWEVGRLEHPRLPCHVTFLIGLPELVDGPGTA